MGLEGNKIGCTKGEPSDIPLDPPKSPSERDSKDKRNLVRIGRRFFSKDLTSTKKFQFGIELGKSPSGIRVKSLNKVVSKKERTYKPVNKRLPACPGEGTRPPTPIPEEGERELGE